MEGVLLDNHIHLHDDPDKPNLGDQRVSYEVLRPGLLSVLAVQHDDGFRAWLEEPSRPVLLAHPGSMTATELIWIERRKALAIGGVVASMGGFFCCLSVGPFVVILLLVVVVARALSGSKAAVPAKTTSQD